MKLIKLSLIAICFIVFANMCQAAEYYCGDARYTYNNANLYDSGTTAKQKCKWLKTDIIISDIPLTYTYKQCVDNFNAAKAKYDRGMCTPVLTEKHLWKGYKCFVKSVQGTNRVIQTSCNTENPDVSEDAMYYFEKMYQMQNDF